MMNVPLSEVQTMLALSTVNGVGSQSLKNIFKIYKSTGKELLDIASRNNKIDAALCDKKFFTKAVDFADYQIEEAEKHGDIIACYDDENYPALLKDTNDAPFFMFIRGNLSKFKNNAVAVIGTREPTVHGKIITERITQFFIDNNWSVVSGLARGCDCIAHEQAINNHGHTVAVLAHGLQTIAPAGHKKIAAGILDTGGALVTEYPYGVKPSPNYFVQRDRIQAGLSQGVVMVQSDLRGGSLHASRASLSYGRWLAVPFPTKRDLKNKENKIQANLLLSSDDFDGKSQLMKGNSLEKIIILESKKDYKNLLTKSSVESNSNGFGF